MAVIGGGAKAGIPFAYRWALIPDNSPIAVDSMYPSTPVICPAKKRFE
jgi:hypothetical protein